jgi:hypothetical protein
MEHSVKLERLPDGLQFPADAAERIRYDFASHKLIYNGFMSKSEFDKLCLLSDDWGFRRQLEELFRLCGPEEAGRPRGIRRLLGTLTSFI